MFEKIRDFRPIFTYKTHFILPHMPSHPLSDLRKNLQIRGSKPMAGGGGVWLQLSTELTDLYVLKATNINLCV